ncbi:MAG: hypothetical protein ACTHMY_29385 [Solirubrobacteraceae bacterium]
METSIPARMDRLPWSRWQWLVVIGRMRRSELGDLIGCKYWGPRRFARALKTAVDQGRIRHSGVGRYAPIGGRRD